jgi:hypothetical protein
MSRRLSNYPGGTANAPAASPPLPGALAGKRPAGRNPVIAGHLWEAEPSEHVTGYHMAVVAGMIFFAVRALFALLPAFSNRHPIKKCVSTVEIS